MHDDKHPQPDSLPPCGEGLGRRVHGVAMAPRLVWRRVAALAEIADGKPFPVTIDDAAIALYRINGALHAVSDICSHEYVRLSEGALAGAAIECPLHRSRFDVTTGRCLARPAEHDLATYDVRIDGDAVFVRVEAAC